MEDVLFKNGFAFKKKFGQNFLTDENLLSAIVRDAGVGEETTVLEIGAGAGALTRALAKRARRVFAYEIDTSLVPVLKETLGGFPNITLRFEDFMKVSMPSLEEELGAYTVVANLPYYITTPLLMRFAEESERATSVTVMVQEEVARRLCAKPGTAEYGAVTAALARRGECRILRTVSRERFTPHPNVDSAVVRVVFGEGLNVKSVAAYRAAVRAAFLSRRKTLENNLVAAFHLTREIAREVMAEAGAETGVRGETLSPQQFALLADALFSRGIV